MSTILSDFHPVALTDEGWMKPLLFAFAQQGSEYTFANSYNWRGTYGIEVAKVGERCLIRSTKKGHSYLYPAGTGEARPALEAMAEAAHAAGEPLRLHCLSNLLKGELEELFPGRFTYVERRDSWDYLYDRESLATLGGKKLHGKRNHINRFLAENQWSYEPITPENLGDCREMNAQWCALMGCEDHDSLREEACAVKSALGHFTELSLIGGLLRVEGRVVAYTLASPVREDTLVIHIEKAFPDVQGAYPMINQQFIQNACGDYTTINREEDLGEEGLRKAKLSYQPAAMVEKWVAQENL